MIGKRLLMIYMLDRGATLYQVSKVLGVSFSTVARFQLRLEQGRFNNARRWLKTQFGSRWIRKAFELAVIPFALQRKSLRYLLHD